MNALVGHTFPTGIQLTDGVPQHDLRATLQKCQARLRPPPAPPTLRMAGPVPGTVCAL
jgi:hypothetical protein